MKAQINDTNRDGKTPSETRQANLSPDGKWRSFSKVPNLLQYVSTGSFYGRVKVDGKLYRESLETDVFSTAKLKLADFIKAKTRKRRQVGTPVTFAEARALYEQDLENDHTLADGSKRYRRYCIQKLFGSWPDLAHLKLNSISEARCKEWAAKFSQEVDEQYFNNTLGTLRGILKRAGIVGIDDPTKDIKRLGVKPGELHLPEPDQFQKLLETIETSGAGQAKHCADFVRFLAFSGCRLSEARQVHWADINLERGFMTVHSVKKRKTADRAITRTVPIIQDMKLLLNRLSAKEHSPQDRVCVVGECEKSLTRGCRLLDIPRITHHDLRHLFATRCIEAGVDIPTVSRWLGHNDGGALAMSVYGHLRDTHSTEMAQKVVFAETAQNIVPLPLAVPSQGEAVTMADDAGKMAIAQAKAKYAYPWWASTNAMEVFWGQLNETVQIVPLDKFHASAKAAMNRDVFPSELVDRQSLKEEFSVRISKATLVELSGKIQAKPTEGEQKAS